MKDGFNRRYFNIALSCFLVTVASIVFFLIIRDLKGFFSSISSFLEVFSAITLGIVLSYIINPAITFFEKKIFRFKRAKKDRSKFKRILSVSVVYLIILIIIAFIICLLLPNLTESIMAFVTNFNTYLLQFSEFTKEFSSLFEHGDNLIIELNEYILKFGTFIKEYLQSNIPKFFGFFIKATDGILNVFLAFIISIYLSLSKEKFISQIKKFMLAMLPRKVCDNIMRFAHVVDESFSKYIPSVFISSIIIGVLCYLCMTIFGLEYALLISFIVMMTDIIPYFGPFIGAGIGGALLLLIKPIDAFWFLVIILILQQITGNIINPKVIGKITGLDSIYVILSIIIMGGFFGIVGMIVGVPVFVILLRVIRKLISMRTGGTESEKPAE